ncbi:MAG TPA: hypothetical protein VJK72_02715 [Candidatus Nanoarchaeia archaeon]|nr:hypothetical protein [Candidatus Nanoarchaeia archaeon]
MSLEYATGISEVEEKLAEVRNAFGQVKSNYSGVFGFFRGLLGLSKADQQALDDSVVILSSLYAQNLKECRDIASRSIEDNPTGLRPEITHQLRREIAHLRQDIRDYIVEFNEDKDLD